MLNLIIFILAHIDKMQYFLLLYSFSFAVYKFKILTCTTNKHNISFWMPLFLIGKAQKDWFRTKILLGPSYFMKNLTNLSTCTVKQRVVQVYLIFVLLTQNCKNLSHSCILRILHTNKNSRCLLWLGVSKSITSEYCFV